MDVKALFSLFSDPLRKLFLPFPVTLYIFALPPFRLLFQCLRLSACLQDSILICLDLSRFVLPSLNPLFRLAIFVLTDELLPSDLLAEPLLFFQKTLL